MFKNKIDVILREIENVLSEVKQEEVDILVDNLVKSKKIVVIGAGRVGMAAKAFAMRLMHLGMEAYTLNDCNLPAIGKGDLLIVCSGSGETQTIYDLTLIAKNTRVKIISITANPDSRIGNLADFVVEIKAPSKTNKTSVIKSVQPMTTLMEQSLFLFFDALVLNIMEEMGINNDQMKIRHSVLE